MHVVIFYSQLNLNVDEYGEWADRMSHLVQEQPGFSHSHSFRNEDGFGVTLSYWESEADIERWGEQPEHVQAQQFGASRAYLNFRLERAHITQVKKSPNR